MDGWARADCALSSLFILTNKRPDAARYEAPNKKSASDTCGQLPWMQLELKERLRDAGDGNKGWITTAEMLQFPADL